MHHQKRSPLNFFILTFLYSWGIWLPSILVGLGLNLNIDALTYTAITIPIGAFAPLFAAITLIVKRHGWKEAWAFIKQGFNFKVKPIYLALAILIPLVIHTLPIIFPHFLASKLLKLSYLITYLFLPSS
jgi:hypothetical protein